MEIFKSNNVTIRDIAARLGVSTATVSMALSGKGQISAEVRQNILQTAKKMGYETNKIGHALMMKNVTIGVMIPQAPAVVQDNIKRGILDACEENKGIKFKCLMLEYDYDVAMEEKCFQTLYQSCDGVIIEFDAGREEPHSQTIDKINARHLPVVSIVVKPSRLHTDLHVSVDAESIGRMAADVFHLGLSKGSSREIVVIGGTKGVDIHQRILLGFETACSGYGLTIGDILYSNDKTQNIPPLLQQALQSHPGTAGIFVTNYLAYCVCQELKQTGRADDIIVVGMDVFEQNNACVLDGSLNVLINQQQRLQAKTAFNELIDRILNSSTTAGPKKIQIPGQIVLPGNVDCYISDNAKP